jgi:NAD(P)H-flavin reductase
MMLIPDGPAGGATGDPMVAHPYRIYRVHKETLDTFTLELAPLERPTPFPFQPGQFNMLYLFGVGEIPISISGHPLEPRNLTHTTRLVGTVTRAMAGLQRDEVLGVRGPFGTGWPLAEARGRDVVLVAGGIGLAPLRPALYHLLSERRNYGKCVLLYGVRTPEDLLYRRELEKWRGSLDMDIYVTVDRSTGHWRGNVGVVTSLIPRAPFDPLNTIAFICGPEIMMRYTVLELFKRGVAESSMYVSLERNMKCAIGFCGHCQFGPFFLCKEGPVFRYDRVKDWMSIREL